MLLARGEELSVTTTCAGVELLRTALLEIYWEQLQSRPKPAGRSQESFNRILSTAHRACTNRLRELYSVPEIFGFALKCLREKDWKTRFLSEAASICSENSISFAEQVAFVNATSEAPDFERSLQITLGFSYSLVSTEQVIDLEGTVYRAPTVFSANLQATPSAPIDLD